MYEYYSKNYTCPECSKCDLPVIKKGKMHMLYGMAFVDTVAWVIYQKFCNGLLYCYQDKDWKQYGTAITRATMVNWVIHNSEVFFFQYMSIFTGNFWQGNSLWRMKRPCRYSMNRDAVHRQNLTCGLSAVTRMASLRLSSINTRKPAWKQCSGFKGNLMCDSYNGYNKVPDAKRTVCWAYIRRYLTDTIPKGKELDYAQPFVQGIMYINQLFHLADVIKAKHISFEAIKKARLEKGKPIVEGFLSWLDNQSPVRRSRMDKAVTYIRNRRCYLTTYLEDGRCSFSNNLSEISLQPFTVDCKNWLFCDTPNGAQASAVVYAMVEMAKANGVNVYQY